MKNIKSISILYLEDDELDVDIIRMTIAEGNFTFNLTHVKSKYEFKTAIRTMNYDVVIADHNLPDIDSFGVLSIVKDINSSIPVIILAGSFDEEEVIKTLKYGASDYIYKDNLHRLLPSIVKVIEDSHRIKKEKFNQEELKRSEERLTTIFHELLDVIIIFDIYNGNIININKAVKKNLGYTRGNLIGNSFFSLFYEEMNDAEKIIFIKRLKNYGYILENASFKDKKGKMCEMEITITIIPWGNEKVGLATLRNISELN
ncbi:MAG: PAS domain S-box protein [Candidatus Delongbacteria bacterium]|jgi:PAS domain S-box-containing protein|nr:PAS domain S-box protein [Candidatus Delongbacteria bacterium]